MAIPNAFNIDFSNGGLEIGQIPAGVIAPKTTMINVAAWLFSVADCTAGMRGGDAVFLYDETDVPAISNTYDVEEVGGNVRVNSPPGAGFLSRDDGKKLAVWLAFYCADGVPSQRGLEDGEGMKERPDLWVKIEEICGDSTIANQRV